MSHAGPSDTPSTELLMMLLADARLPIAGHTQSGGLEPAVAGGVDAAAVPAYIATRLATSTRVEAGTAVVALHRLRHGEPLEPVEAAWAARTPSPAMRATSRTMGRAMLRLAGRLWEVDLAPGTPRPLVLAATARACGLPALSLARLIGYDEVQTISSAALKLLPLDPATATGWVHHALPALERLAAEVADLTDPEQIPATCAPQLESWAEAQATATRRLFSA